MFSLEQTIKSRYYIMIVGNLVGISGLTGLVNVYGPQSVGEKEKV